MANATIACPRPAWHRRRDERRAENPSRGQTQPVELQFGRAQGGRQSASPAARSAREPALHSARRLPLQVARGIRRMDDENVNPGDCRTRAQRLSCTFAVCGNGGPKARRHASPGQRPGKATRSRASPERARQVVSPLQGWCLRQITNPGRCPGLACLRTVGAQARFKPKCMTGASYPRLQ